MTNPIELPDYRTDIALDRPTNIKIDKNWREQVFPLLNELGSSSPLDASSNQVLNHLHGVLAQIDEHALPKEVVARLESVAAGVNQQQPPTEAATLPTIRSTYGGHIAADGKISIWVGDITTLKVDVIVNAANAYLLGCRIPNHTCIDNAIHSAAGPRLRGDCATIINKQGGLEPVGTAKITRAYALPSKYILHTVGPQLFPGSQPSKAEEQQLQNSYLSCLNVAAEVGDIRSIAFCAISTGFFGYPKPQAAQIALSTVSAWLHEHPGRFDLVVFNLYSAADASHYEVLVSE